MREALQVRLTSRHHLQFQRTNTLKRFEPHRLAALVLEDLQRYLKSAISDIHQQIGHNRLALLAMLYPERIDLAEGFSDDTVVLA